MYLPTATPDPLIVWGYAVVAPLDIDEDEEEGGDEEEEAEEEPFADEGGGGGLTRCRSPIRRAWKSPQSEQEEISRNACCPGSHTSRS